MTTDVPLSNITKHQAAQHLPCNAYVTRFSTRRTSIWHFAEQHGCGRRSPVGAAGGILSLRDSTTLPSSGAYTSRITPSRRSFAASFLSTTSDAAALHRWRAATWRTHNAMPDVFSADINGFGLRTTPRICQPTIPFLPYSRDVCARRALRCHGISSRRNAGRVTLARCARLHGGTLRQTPHAAGWRRIRTKSACGLAATPRSAACCCQAVHFAAAAAYVAQAAERQHACAILMRFSGGPQRCLLLACYIHALRSA